MNTKTKNIIVFLLLIFLYPVGILMMLIWRQVWTWWIKLALYLPLILAVLLILAVGFLLMFGNLFGTSTFNQSVNQAKMMKAKVDCESLCYQKPEVEIAYCKKMCIK